MLHINDLTFRMEGRLLLERVTAALPPGTRTGFVGRNGTGKSTLLRIITGELTPESGSISWPKSWRVGMVTQEAPSGPITLLDTVLAADKERTSLLAEAETATDPHRIADIHTRLADMGAHASPAKAATILAGLGFDEAAQARPCSDFSGGWRMRVALAAVLFSEPDLLLLDEPTNYLDLEGTIWLEDYLRSYPYTVLIVSHDRDLLNNVADGILHLEHKKLTYYSGNYDRFDRTRRERLMLQMSMKKKQDDQRRHMESFIERFKAKASKARQAQSRMKALAKMEPIADIMNERVLPFHFPVPEKPLASPIIRLEHASVGYEPGKPVLRGLDLRIDQDDRIALLGANGNGKSTFAKLLCDRLRVDAGHKYASKKLRIAYFAQHQLDELNMGDTPYEHFRELMPDATIAQVRARAGSYGFGADKADTRVEKLSGGEKARLLFAIATFHKPHMIILDEPTNHLDVDSREALVMAINEYDGAFILISHDRHLVETCADRLWLVADGTVAPYDGDLDDYRKWLLDPARRVRPLVAEDNAGADAPPPAPRPSNDKREARRLAAQKREQMAPLKKKAQAAEQEIARIQKIIDALDARLTDPAVTADPAAVSAASKDRAEALRARARAEELWLEASTSYEEAMAAAD
ncbi:ABC-F family ATP-binding cassette domain-containing protein [Parvibaculum sp.]|uniref:ABC-F family ATP-binding cassette domain-containing protein n=1 Tax=Parvibaculum sp. TaxID=2024848 RepID=UPI001D5229D5|nr:ABC-F family ATP-binding cassette domain-containing protein [Parvibaculum sp.]MBX3491077.1 ABC-F family ATP-binding cassette domain-containing protein [Parvibaculum sp.]MCW5728897.1 ABC-F family ATP-binding cassette domain-containing protein [Parvibaculum sp.]